MLISGFHGFLALLASGLHGVIEFLVSGYKARISGPFTIKYSLLKESSKISTAGEVN